MLTGDPLKLVASAMGFILMGMFTGNTVLLYLGLISLIFIFAALALHGPEDLQYNPPQESMVAYVDDELDIVHHILDPLSFHRLVNHIAHSPGRDMNHMGIAKEVMEIPQNLLIRPDQEDAQIYQRTSKHAY